MHSQWAPSDDSVQEHQNSIPTAKQVLPGHTYFTTLIRLCLPVHAKQES